MRYLLNDEQMKAADQHTIRDLGIPSRVLMERAAASCVDYIIEHNLDTSRVCIVCGSGNNGGDGFAIGRMLLEQGAGMTLIFVGNPEHRTEENVWQTEQFEKAGGTVLFECSEEHVDYTLVIDSLFGVGLNREITGRYREVIEWMNRCSGKKLAVDAPSGVSSATGEILGCVFEADVTITFQECKLGLVLFPGRKAAGRVCVTDVGIDSGYITKRLDVVYTFEQRDAEKLLPVRAEDANKGTFGRVLMIAGSKGMAGAAFLSSYSAYIAGAGLVQIYTAEENRVVLQELLPEAILSVYDDFQESILMEKLAWADVVCIGPGIGTSDTSESILRTVLNHCKVPCIIDADGLNILSEDPVLMEKLGRGDYILTPHMKELSRLVGCTVGEIKRRRIEVLRRFIEKYPVVLVQKDAGTMVGCREKRSYMNTTGNAAMAKAGSGDVLAGVITALTAQGLDCYEAAVLGVYIHGMSGDLKREELGSYSVLARDLAKGVGTAMRILEKGRTE